MTEPILSPRVFCMRALPELLGLDERTSLLKLFEVAASRLGIPESLDAARIAHAQYLETGYPPAFIEGAFNDAVKEKMNDRKRKHDLEGGA